MQMMPKKIKVTLIVFCVLLVLALAGVALAGNYMVSFAIGRTAGAGNTASIVPPSEVSEEDSRAISDHWQRLAQQTKDWGETVQRESASVTSEDGLTLYAEYALNPEPSHLWLIAVHGYRGNHTHMFTLASFYGLRGYNVLLPDLRGCGESQGDYIGMGWPDRKDMLLWIDWIIRRDPEARIVLHGISMGGATVTMTAGEALPPQVRAIVEDCGYTSVWDIFGDELQVIFHLPQFPILPAASAIASLRAGYSFSEASSLNQVKKAKVPMLFIHGEKDNFVRTGMVYPMYEACPTEKKLLVVEGAGHGSSYSMDPELYFDTVFGFIAPYMQDGETK